MSFYSSSVKEQPAAAGQTASNTNDPFNWNPLQRADTMSLQVINRDTDGDHSRTEHYRARTRQVSNNLTSSDI